MQNTFYEQTIEQCWIQTRKLDSN